MRAIHMNAKPASRPCGLFPALKGIEGRRNNPIEKAHRNPSPRKLRE